jgi:hypothetical protein
METQYIGEPETFRVLSFSEQLLNEITRVRLNPENLREQWIIRNPNIITVS